MSAAVPIATLVAFVALVALVAVVVLTALVAQLEVPVKLPNNPTDADTCAKSNTPALLLKVLFSGL